MTDKKRAQRYKAPDELLDPGKEGQLLEWSLQHCFGGAPWQTIFREGMGGVVRQTVYGWTQSGLPPERQEQFQAFIDDPDSGFTLPANTKIQNFFRARAERPKEERVQKKRNQPLLDFLVDVIKADHPFGAPALETIAAKMRNVSSTHLFWKWGYNDGGVPVTYIEDFVRWCIELRLYETLDIESYRKPEVFAAYARKSMCVDETYYEKYYELEDPDSDATDQVAQDA